MKNINIEKNIKHFKAMKSNWSEKMSNILGIFIV